jgi:MoaA/NifB/PqqE/SkfB family radical SAM enzyme
MMHNIVVAINSLWENELERQEQALHELGVSYKLIKKDVLPGNENPVLYIRSPIAFTAQEINTISEQASQSAGVACWMAQLNNGVFLPDPVAIYGPSGMVGEILKIKSRLRRKEGIIDYLKSVYRRIRPLLPRSFERSLLKTYLKESHTEQPELLGEGSFMHLPNVYLERLFCDHIKEIYPFPKSLQVVITNQCNLSCRMCPYHSKNYGALFKTDYFGHSLFMAEEIFRRVAIEAGHWKTQLRFGNIEEPFIHQKLESFAEEAAKRGVPSMHISTNGTLFRREKLMRLLRAGVNDWQVSINALSDESYRRICGEKFSYRKVVDHVRLLIELKSKYFSKVNIRVSAIKGLLNDEEVERFIDFWRAEGADQATIYVLSDEDGKANETFLPRTEINEAKRRPCLSAWKEAYILPGGEVGVCCKTVMDLCKLPLGVLSLGQIKNGFTIQDIWLGDPFQELRRSLVGKGPFSYKPCDHCSIWAAFDTKFETTSQGDFVEMNPWMKIITYF